MLSTGIEALDRLLPGAVSLNTLLVIAGHPGSGKTTLATSICYNNALNGNSCLYISFQESRDKLYRIVRNLGMDLELVESIGRFRFLKMPLTTDGDMALEIIDIISRAVHEFNPKIIVIDSITPLLKVLESNIRARSVLQNYFYELPNQISGAVILVAEIPLYIERIELGDIEFVADTVIILRHKIENNLLVRELEVRKARGSPITVARVPFTIVEGSGIRIFTPIRLEEVPDINWDKKFRQPCKIFQDAIGHYYGGETIYIEYPLYSRPLRIFLYGLALMIVNGARTIIFSYKTSAKQLTGLFQHLLKGYGIEMDVGELLEKAVELGYVRLLNLNPSAYSIEELYHLELMEIERFKPDIAMFIDVDAINSRDGVYFNLLRNQILSLKKMGILTIRLGARCREPDYPSIILADSIVRNIAHRDGRDIKRDIYVWRIGREPRVIAHEEVEECVKECTEIVKELPTSLYSRVIKE